MHNDPIQQPFNRILLTGAGGGLGRILRERIKPWARTVRLSDISDIGPAGPDEEVVRCDLADKQAVLSLLEGVDAVIHFGGISTEHPFEQIMQANILGTYNLYEAAHRKGTGRIVFASSNHTVGFYKTTDVIDANDPVRPDSFYGVSKCFGESLSRFYYDRFGLETVCLRIGSSFPEPRNVRMMSTYLSYDDMTELVRCALFAPRVGHAIVFGASANPSSWWDNREAAFLGYRPKDSSAQFAHLFPATAERPRRDDPATVYQGGPFVTAGPHYPLE